MYTKKTYLGIVVHFDLGGAGKVAEQPTCRDVMVLMIGVMSLVTPSVTYLKFWYSLAPLRCKIRNKIRKTRQNTEHKQTFSLTGKIETNEKTCQNAGNKQTFDLKEKIEIERKTRQNDENKQSLISRKNLKLRENSSKRWK